jgi:hypothetical protein
MNNIIMINIDWKKKIVMLVQPKEMQLEVDEAGSVVINKEMLKAPIRTPEKMFEEELVNLLTVEQEIKLYKCWGMALSITIGHTSDRVGIDKRLAKQIIMLAEEYNLLYKGNNYSWKLTNKDIKGRWLDIAKDKESYSHLGERPMNADMPKTPQESIDRLAKMSTPEQKAKARGEKVVEEEEESSVEIVDENKIYSPAAKEKAKQQKEWEEKVKKDKANALQEMNKNKTVLPKCITVLSRKENVQEETGKDKGEIPTKKKPLPTRK